MARITIEDCLKKVNNRFTLIHMASQRVRQLRKGADASIPSKNRATLGSAMNVIWAIANALSAFIIGIGINYLGLVNTTILSGIIALITAFVYFFSVTYSSWSFNVSII